MPEKGLVLFIKSKLENAVPMKDIRRMLHAAGFSEGKIDEAFEYVKREYHDTHQDLAALNDFLPELMNKEDAARHPAHPHAAHSKARRSSSSHKYSAATQSGLFNGRLRRKDFTLGFLFFFALGYVALAFSAFIVALAAPDLWNALMALIGRDSQGLLVMIVPVMLLPVTIMMISLITRRLHNLGLPGGLSLLFLLIFMPLSGPLGYLCVFALDMALCILFVILLAVKGDPSPNAYGPLPPSEGSFFRRIFNQ